MLILVLAVNICFVAIWLKFALAAYIKKIRDIISEKRRAAEAAKAKKLADKQKLLQFKKEKDAVNSPEMREVQMLFAEKNTKRLRRKSGKSKRQNDALKESPTELFGTVPTEPNTSGAELITEVPIEPLEEAKQAPANSEDDLFTSSDLSITSSVSKGTLTTVNTVKRPPSAIKRDQGRRNIRIRARKILPKPGN
jgi:hypothetical protein